MMLSDRQKKAETLARELQAAGAAVTTALPLADGAKLRFQVLDSIAEAVLEDLRGSEWSPAFVSTLPRITHKGMEAASVYEINLPERQPVADDRIHGEIAVRDPKMEADILAMLKACGFQK